MVKNKIGAAVVIYNPDRDTIDNIKCIALQYDDVIVFNNSCSEEILGNIEKIDRVKIIGDGINYGIAYALSASTAYLIRNGCQYITTFDQDTKVESEFYNKLELSIKEIENCSKKIGIIGSNYTERKLGKMSPQINLSKLIFRRFIPKNYAEVTSVISSGSTLSADLHYDIGLYCDDLFIDYVDNEICYRAINNGYSILISPHLIINHTLGDRSEYKIGKFAMHPTNHSVIRKYYISRNRVYCMRKYAKYLKGMILFEILAIVNDILRIALFEENKSEKFFAIFKGLLRGMFFEPSPVIRMIR